MRLPRVPSRSSALLSGALFGLGLPLLQSWQSASDLSQAADRLASTLSLVVLFVAPVLVFVVGTRHFTYSPKDAHSTVFRDSLAQVGVRALCWIVGACVAFAGPVLLRDGLPL